MADSPPPFRSPVLSERPAEVDLDALAATWEANTRTQEQMVASMRRMGWLLAIEVVSLVLATWIGVTMLTRHLDEAATERAHAAAQRAEQRAMLVEALSAQMAVTEVQIEEAEAEAQVAEAVAGKQPPLAVVVAPVAEAKRQVARKRVAAREKVRRAARKLSADTRYAPDAARPE